MNRGSASVPLLASQQGGVAERSRKYRGASIDREAGVVFRSKHVMKTTPSAPAKEASRHLIMAHPPLLAVMQGGDSCTTAIHSRLHGPPLQKTSSGPAHVLLVFQADEFHQFGVRLQLDFDNDCPGLCVGLRIVDRGLNVHV